MLPARTCQFCQRIFYCSNYAARHELKCHEKLRIRLELEAEEGAEELVAGSRRAAKLAHKVLTRKPVPPFSTGDGGADLSNWAERPADPNPLQREPVAIECDIRKLDWSALRAIQWARHKRLFDVILMDPPWSVGEPLDYPVLPAAEIFRHIPLNRLQTTGYVMVWVLVRTERATMQELERLGYEYKGRITWTKLTSHGNLVNGNGVTLRHSKEDLLVYGKGHLGKITRFRKVNDVLPAQVQGASKKPEQLRQRIHQLVPVGHYLEVFARRHNLHPNWVSVGNMLHVPEHPA